jgi:hypothetical protein
MSKKEKKVKAFKDLDEKELRRSAVEDFAINVDDVEGKDALLAAFVETGVSWADYVKQHPEYADEEEEKPAVVTSSDVTGRKAEVATAKEAGTVRTAEPAIRNEGDSYLIKMTRDNVLYETRGYRFTQEHPYALVSAKDAQYILSKEDGFRQAFPDELEEFYG